MDEILEKLEDWRGRGSDVAVATVVKTSGSTPRGEGAKLLVRADGELAGSVSGGCVETDVALHAQEVLQAGRPRLVSYGISDEMAFNVGLACGGQIEVFIQPFGKAFPTEKPVAFAYVIDGEGQGNGLLAWEFGKHRGSLGQGDDFDDRVARDSIALLRDGRIVPLERVRTKRKAIDRIVDIMAGEVDGKPYRCAIGHAFALEDALAPAPLSLPRLSGLLIRSPCVSEGALRRSYPL